MRITLEGRQHRWEEGDYIADAETSDIYRVKHVLLRERDESGLWRHELQVEGPFERIEKTNRPRPSGAESTVAS